MSASVKLYSINEVSVQGRIPLKSRVSRSLWNIQIIENENFDLKRIWSSFWSFYYFATKINIFIDRVIWSRTIFSSKQWQLKVGFLVHLPCYVQILRQMKVVCCTNFFKIGCACLRLTSEVNAYQPFKPTFRPDIFQFLPNVRSPLLLLMCNGWDFRTPCLYLWPSTGFQGIRWTHAHVTLAR